jgi:beta-fructofuranosidase
MYSLPRLVNVDADGRLHQKPFEGISKWSEPAVSLTNINLTDGEMRRVGRASGKSFNLRAIIRRSDSRSTMLRVRSSPDAEEYTEISYQWEIGKLVLDRSHSSLDPSVRRDTQNVTWFPDESGVLSLDLFLDQSVLEVFVGQRSAFATRIYPTLDASTEVLFGSDGGSAKIETLEVAYILLTQ